MAVNDVYIYDWSAELDNSPADSQTIGTDLGAQLRNIKSVYRLLSKNKLYEDLNPAQAAPTIDQQGAYFGSVIFYFSGNVLDQFQPGRKLVAQNPANGDLVGGTVILSDYVVSNNQTMMFAAFWRNSWSTAYSVLYLGTDNGAPSSFAQNSIGGTLAFQGSTTTLDVELNTKKSPSSGVTTADYSNYTKFFMPTKDYVVHLSPCYKDGNASENCSVVKKVDKDYQKFTVTLYDAPGTVDSVDQRIFFDWYITMPRYCS